MRLNHSVLVATLSGIAFIASAGMSLADPAIATANVNVRTGPGTSYGVVGVLTAGQRLDIQACQAGWCYIRGGFSNGWVSGQYLADISAPSRPSSRFTITFGTPPSYPRPGNRPPPPPHYPNGGYYNDGPQGGYHPRPGNNRPDWDDHDRPGWNNGGNNRPGWNDGSDDRPGGNRPGDHRPGGNNRPGDDHGHDNDHARPGDNHGKPPVAKPPAKAPEKKPTKKDDDCKHTGMIAKVFCD